MNKCLDGDSLFGNTSSPAALSPAPPEAEPGLPAAGGLLHLEGRVQCMLCGHDVTPYNDQRRCQHLDRCADKLPQAGDGTMTGKRYACILCKKDLSGRDIHSRVGHVRKCARKNRVSVADMGNLLAQSKIEDRMPEVGSVLPKRAPTIPKLTRTAKEDAALTASGLSNDASALSGGLSLDSQHDLAGFRISQRHGTTSAAVSSNPAATAQQLALLPFEDDLDSSSQLDIDNIAPESTLAAKYSRDGGSPRRQRLNLWSFQGMDSVDAFDGRSAKPFAGLVPAASSSPPKSQHSMELPPSSLMSQSGAGAVDALVELFDQEDLLEDRSQGTARRRLNYLEEDPSGARGKKRSREPEAIQDPRALARPPEVKRPKVEIFDLRDVESRLSEVLHSSALRMEEAKARLDAKVAKAQTKFHTEVHSNNLIPSRARGLIFLLRVAWSNHTRKGRKNFADFRSIRAIDFSGASI